MTTQIKTWGNSLAVRIPKEISRKLRLHSGSQVQILTNDNTVIVRPVKKEKITLTDLVSKITKENKHSIIFNHKAQGKEVW